MLTRSISGCRPAAEQPLRLAITGTDSAALAQRASIEMAFRAKTIRAHVDRWQVALSLGRIVDVTRKDRFVAVVLGLDLLLKQRRQQELTGQPRRTSGMAFVESSHRE